MWPKRLKARPTGVALLALAGVLVVACSDSQRLAPPPNILTGTGVYQDVGIPVFLRTTTPRIFYVTDRTREPGAPSVQRYAAGRSSSMAFGVRTVAFGEGLSWAGLKALSVDKGMRRAVKLRTLRSEELVRFPATPLPFSSVGGQVRTLPGPAAKNAAAERRFKAEIAQELARAGQDSAIIYIHGNRNGFDDAAATLVNLWHFAGRRSIPIAYSWPTRKNGFLEYLSARESSEFSVFHLKAFLRMLAEVPGLKRIHIVAHSRGTDLATTALREMIIAERAAGRNPRRTLKIETLILAAADLNFDVVRQRLIAERIGPAFGQIVVYMNPRDSALGLAQRVMRGRRFGRITASNLGPEEREIFARIKNVNFINVEQVGGNVGHSYFRKNPDVMSDIILTLQTGALPGGSERPLKNITVNFWNMHKGYPFARPKTQVTHDPNEDRP
jgi:pimeloyl-ACP methyl ester carboxylesterase